MPTIKKRITLTDDIPEGNPLSGSQYEYLPFPAVVEMAVLADAGKEVQAYASSGTDILLENARIDELAVASPIIYPDHYAIRDVAARGERLGLSLRKVTAGDVVVRVAVQITPM